MEKKILVTGGAGFIGSNFLNFWSVKYPQDKLIVLDKITYAANPLNINYLKESKIIFIKGDIADKDLVQNILKKNLITHLVNFAAESHVDRSISSPKDFFKTNLEGTYNLLNSFHEHWRDMGSQKDWRFLHISTDEVYGSLKINEEKFNEYTPYSPRSPYSATKAGSDHLVMAWFHTYGLPVIISNCSNNYGPYQHPEKLIPKTIINGLLGQEIPIYGNGENIRDWLFVSDHVNAIEKIITKALPGSRYCIGGKDEINNIDLVNMICEILDRIKKNVDIKNRKILVKFVKDRPGHDFRYSINSSLIEKELNWFQKVSLIKGLEETIQWYISNKNWWESIPLDS